MLAEHAEPPVLAYSGDASADSGARHRQVHEPRAQVEELARVERLREDVGEVVVAGDERRLELARLHELAHVEVAAVDVLRARVDRAGVVRDVDDAAVVDEELGRLRRAAEEWAETLAPWMSYSVLLVVVLLPPIGLVGVVTLALLLSLLYVHQSFVLPESRARLQRPIWALLALLMAAALVVTWAFGVPSIHRALVAPHGLLGPACDGPAPPNGSGTFCANVLYDLGLAEQA